MSNSRRQRRQAARAAGVPFQPEPHRRPITPAAGDLRPQDLANLDKAKWKGGDPLLATQPAASDGTPESIASAKLQAHDTLIEEVDAAGGTRVGPVVWYEWAAADVPMVLGDLGREDDRYHQFDEWFAEHPEGTFVLAAVVTVPPADPIAVVSE